MSDMDDKKDQLDIEDDIDLVEEFEEGTGLPDAVEISAPEEEPFVPEEGSGGVTFTAEEGPITEELAPEPEEEAPIAGAAKRLSEELLKVAPDISVNLAAVIGKITTNVSELAELKRGYVVDLKRPPNETVDLVANGKLVARGELVEIDGRLGVRVVKLVR